MTQTTWSLAFLTAAVAGCSAPVTPDTCTLVPGTYEAVFVETSGSCGPLAREDVRLEDGGPPSFGSDSSCTGEVDVTADRCSAAVGRACELLGPDNTVLGTVYYRGTTTILDDAHAEGTVTIERDGTGAGADCSSTYDVTWTLRRPD